MTDSCATCFFVRQVGNDYYCNCHAPELRIDVAVDSASIPPPWPRVAPASWCGEGADATSGRPFGAAWHDVVTVATLPTGRPAGIRLFVSDAQNKNFGTVVNGGGSNFVPVYTDGLNNWYIG